jgi:hypothetical protein
MYSKESTTLFTAASSTNAVTTNSGGGRTIPEWATYKSVIAVAAVVGLVLFTGAYCMLRTKRPE